MDCPKCGAYNASSSTHCRRCGQELPVDDDFQERPEPSFTPEEDWSEWQGSAGQPDEELTQQPWSDPKPVPSDSWPRETGEEWGAASSGYGIPAGRPADPAPGPGYPAQGTVQSYLWPAVGATLCCCTPLGIPAIIYAARVDAFMRNNDRASAQDASNKARNWLIAAVAVAIVGWIVIFLSGTFSSNTTVSTS